jgi:hypothetical protein
MILAHLDSFFSFGTFSCRHQRSIEIRGIKLAYRVPDHALPEKNTKNFPTSSRSA